MNAERQGPLAGPLASSTTSSDPAPRAGSRQVSDATHPPTGDDLISASSGSQSVSARVGRRRLAQLADQLADRDRAILETVGKLRLVRTDQVRRLFFSELKSEPGRARVCRRALQRLTQAGLLRALERRLGGVRAGSSGATYALAPAGRRLLAYWAGAGISSDRGVYEPGLSFVTHTLAIGDLYVTLVEADRAGLVELLSFETEPVRTYVSAVGGTVTLKADALVELGDGEYIQTSLCEVDMATEGRGALTRKCRAYLDYSRTGREQAEHGVFPRVVWITPSRIRAAYIADLVASLPGDARRLFACTTTEGALTALTGTDTPSSKGGDA